MIHLDPLYGYLLCVLVAVCAVVVAWAGRAVVSYLQVHAKFLSAQTDALIQQGVQTVLQDAIDYGIARFRALAKANPDIDAHSTILSWAVNYVLAHGASYMAHFGLDAGSVANMVAAHLPDVATLTDTTGATVKTSPVTVTMLTPITA